jgi:pimeloyl-ACP methyl ester carboxylesterase
MADVLARGLRFHVQRLAPGTAGPIVVLLHGLVMDNLSSLYFTLAGPLSQASEVLLYDLRGHGMSERPASGYGLDEMVADLDAILASCAADRRVILVGNSFGGLLALAFAAKAGDRVAGVALLDGHLGEAGWADKMAATLDLKGEARDQRIGASFASWLGRHGDRKATRLAKNASALVYDTSLVADLRASASIADADLRRVACPVLALYGESSDLRAAAERAAGLLPSCDLRIFPGCTHSILWEATERVQREMQAFVAALSPARAVA